MFRRSLVFALAAICLLPVSALADDDDRDDGRKLRKAINRNDILPLEEILRRIGPDLGGKVIEIETEKEDGRLLYEIYVLTPNGRRMELYVDPRTAQIIKRKADD